MRILKIEDVTTSEKFLFNLEQVTVRYIGTDKLRVHTTQGIHFEFLGINKPVEFEVTNFEAILYDSIADSIRYFTCNSSRIMKGVI